MWEKTEVNSHKIHDRTAETSDMPKVFYSFYSSVCVFSENKKYTIIS